MMQVDMTIEMETKIEISEPVEILPEGIGQMPAQEAAPLLARASSRIETLGLTGEFWNGVKENLEGAAAWIKAEKAGLIKKSLSAVASISFLTAILPACSNRPGTPYIPTETTPRVTEISPTFTEIVPTLTPPRYGGWSQLEKNGQPYDGTVGGLANLAAECNAMGQSKGAVKIFTFNADTKFPTTIDATQAIITADEVIKSGNLELQPTNFNQDWTDLTGKKHSRGVILTVPDGHGVASGFEVTAPEGGWVLVTTDPANAKLAKYELFRLPYWH